MHKEHEDCIVEPGDLPEWKAYYLRVWRGLLGACLGWNEQDVHDWALRTRNLDALDDSGAWVYHEPPQNEISSLLIPKQLANRLTSLERIRVEAKIDTALDGDIVYFRYPDDVDWTEYRRKVESVLAIAYAANTVSQNAGAGTVTVVSAAVVGTITEAIAQAIEQNEKCSGDECFVHGTSSGSWYPFSGYIDECQGDFGAGFYTFRSDGPKGAWGIEKAAEHAQRRAKADGSIPKLMFFKMPSNVYRPLNKQRVKADDWGRAISHYPYRYTGFDLVIGPAGQNFKPERSKLPDQYKFEGKGIIQLQFDYEIDLPGSK